MVCWAGGGGGPHFFVNLIDNAGFRDEHLCFGQVESSDDAGGGASGMAVLEAVLGLRTKPKAKPDDMTLLVEPLRFNITIEEGPGARQAGGGAA